MRWNGFKEVLPSFSIGCTQNHVVQTFSCISHHLQANNAFSSTELHNELDLTYNGCEQPLQQIVSQVIQDFSKPKIVFTVSGLLSRSFDTFTWSIMKACWRAARWHTVLNEIGHCYTLKRTPFSLISSTLCYDFDFNLVSRWNETSYKLHQIWKGTCYLYCREDWSVRFSWLIIQALWGVLLDRRLCRAESLPVYVWSNIAWWGLHASGCKMKLFAMTLAENPGTYVGMLCKDSVRTFWTGLIHSAKKPVLECFISCCKVTASERKYKEEVTAYGM